MKSFKKQELLNVGRKFVLTLALFVLVFAVASIVKIQAAGNVTGWLWGGSEETNDGSINGNETGVGWISMNGTNYGVNIPPASCSGNACKVTGYAWANASNTPGTSSSQEENGLGWIDFNPQDHCVTGAPGSGQYRAASCTPPSGSAGVFRSGDFLIGWARFVSIAQESANNNSGGWSGWIHMDGNYGVDITRMDGTPNNPTWATAGTDELGWIDFSRAEYIEPCTPLCGGADLNSYCTGSGGPTSELCALNQGTPSSVNGGVNGPWDWTCTCQGTSVSCDSSVAPTVNGACGSLNGGSFCEGQTPTSTDLCSSGTPDPLASLLNLDTYEVTWQCDGSCGGTDDDCSAKGKKACGWIETNP